MDDLPEEVQGIIEELDEAAEDEDEDAIEELTQKLLDTGADVETITLKKLALLVMDGEEEMTQGWTRVAIQIGLDPFKTLIEGLATGMSLIGKKYENGEAFVPQLLIASNAMYGGMDLLAPLMKRDENSGSKPATVVIGTVEGDVHDIGKSLVKTLLSANGFNCVDLGNDVPASRFIEAAKESKATAISMSTLMTTTMAEMPRVLKMLSDEGIRDKVMVMVGGAPITTEYASQIGADVSPHDAASAANWLKAAVFDFPPESVRWG
ncbi:corrinoid protein [Methanosarcina sp. KYL-1]|uniref:corrinoid protein n=1 Tax=Methanosarcina sp. KYL-1 TaxID=2602068 RepID=UPI0021017707|nr:corrinoid protein [Methanosarcina sp. KYL-1]MCQ1534367.1 corrinoid protein [Methanosarcina sp. KYL-1]